MVTPCDKCAPIPRALVSVSLAMSAKMVAVNVSTCTAVLTLRQAHAI